MAEKRAVYRWFMHSDGDFGILKLTKSEEDFLSYLADNGFLAKDLEFYFLYESEELN